MRTLDYVKDGTQRTTLITSERGALLKAQFLSTAPKIAESLEGYRYFFAFYRCANCIIICRFTREIRRTKKNSLMKAVPYFDALPKGQIPVDRTKKGT